MASNDLWWDYLCPAMANISPLKEAQRKLMALGVDFAEAGKILSEVHKAYVDAAFQAAQRHERDEENSKKVAERYRKMMDKPVTLHDNDVDRVLDLLNKPQPPHDDHAEWEIR